MYSERGAPTEWIMQGVRASLLRGNNLFNSARANLLDSVRRANLLVLCHTLESVPSADAFHQ